MRRTSRIILVAFVATVTLFLAHAFVLNSKYIEPKLAAARGSDAAVWWAIAFAYYFGAHLLAGFAIQAFKPNSLPF
jgi:hypothetical protein